MTQERMLASQRQDFPLDHRALDVVILKDNVLLQALDGVVSPGMTLTLTLALALTSHLRQDDLTEAALAENFDEAEIVDPVLPEFRPVSDDGCGNGRSGGRVVPARRAGGVRGGEGGVGGGGGGGAV